MKKGYEKGDESPLKKCASDDYPAEQNKND